VVRAVEEMKKHLNEKYKRVLIDTRQLQAIFEIDLLDNYKARSRIQLKMLCGNGVTANGK
jgi:hypothetical protein